MDDFLLFYILSILGGIVTPYFVGKDYFLAVIIGFYLICLGLYGFLTGSVYAIFGDFGLIFASIPIMCGVYLFSKGLFG